MGTTTLDFAFIFLTTNIITSQFIFWLFSLCFIFVLIYIFYKTSTV